MAVVVTCNRQKIPRMNRCTPRVVNRYIPQVDLFCFPNAIVNQSWCSLGANWCFWWNQRAIFIQLRPPLLPVQFGANTVQSWYLLGAPGGTRELFSVNQVLHCFRCFLNSQLTVPYIICSLNINILYCIQHIYKCKK